MSLGLPLPNLNLPTDRLGYLCFGCLGLVCNLNLSNALSRRLRISLLLLSVASATTSLACACK